jgi:O-acetyl-ADP-ribose deacetylase (regulator of RNase III)
MSAKKINGVVIECVCGDIANQPDIEAVVNAANAQLRSGGGVAGAIHRAAGSRLEQECRPLAPIKPGEAVITGAHGLPNRYVIHCLGPVYGQDHPAKVLLANCYRHALALGEQQQISSIAFPAISTGIFGYPIEAAAQVAIATVIDQIPDLSSIKQIRFVLHGDQAQKLHSQILEG